MNGIKYDKRNMTISLLLLIIISFCIQVSAIDNTKPTIFRRVAFVEWLEEFLKSFDRSKNQPSNATVEIDQVIQIIDNSTNTSDSSTTQIIQVIDNSTYSSISSTTQDPSTAVDLVLNTTLQNVSTQDYNIEGSLRRTVDKVKILTEIMTTGLLSLTYPIQQPPDLNSTTTPTSQRQMRIHIFSDSCQDVDGLACDSICEKVRPVDLSEPSSSHIGYYVLVSLVVLFLILIAAILIYISFLIASMKRKHEAETAARLLELAAERRQKIEERRRLREELQRSHSKEEKTQNVAEEEAAEEPPPPPRNDVRERLNRLRVYKDKMDAMQKSDARSTKFEQRGPLYIPAKMILPEAEKEDECAPDIILEKVYYEPAGNEMFDIGTDIEIVGSDRSMGSRKKTKAMEAKINGSKENKGGSKEDDKTLELM